MRMNAGEIYRQLSACPWWAEQRRAVKWMAARYYAGVENCDSLYERAKPGFVQDNVLTMGSITLPPVLSKDEVEEIIRLR